MGGSSSKVDVSGLPVLVVIGGGYGGATLAKALDRRFFVVLIDRKDYFLHKVGLPRAVHQPDFASDCLLPYTSLLTNGVFIQGYVERITAAAVHLRGAAAAVPFDYLVVATGSSYAMPARVSQSMRDTALQRYSDSAQRIQAAQHVLVIGAGPAGVEIAGEIANDYPSKTVTLVSAHSYLCRDRLPDKFYRNVQQHLQRLRVDILYSDRVIIPADVSEKLKAQDSLMLAERRSYQTAAGKQLEADLAFFTVGTKLNNAVVSSAASAPFSAADAVTERGELRVDSHLQVVGFSNIFAIGDVSSAEPAKIAHMAMEQAKFLSKHLPALHEQAGQVGSLPPYKSPFEVACFVSVGRGAGEGTFDGWVLPSFMIRMMKSKALFVERERDRMNLSAGWKGQVELSATTAAERVAKLVQKLKVTERDAQQLLKGTHGTDDLASAAVDHI